MMSPFFDKTFTVKRLTQSGDKSSYQSVSVDGACMLRQAGAHLTQINGLQYGELWEMYAAAGVDVRTTDRVTVDGVDYTVKGVRSDTLGGADYTHILLVKKTL